MDYSTLFGISVWPSVPATRTDLLWLLGLLVVTLLSGIAVGRCLASRTSLVPDELQRLSALLAPLTEWTRALAEDMSQYRSVVDGMAGVLRSAPEQLAGHPPDVTVGLLSSVVDANEQLQTRLQEAEQRLKVQADAISLYMSEARTDALTRLPNRRAFDEGLARHVAQWRRHGHPLSVMMVDVDHFKKFNDTHGHQAGDQALRVVSQVLQSTMREADFVTRYGGEELAVILPATDIQEAQRAAQRARQAIEQAPISSGAWTAHVTVSLGVAELHMAETAGDLVGRADAALYAAKQAGRNRAFWHDGEDSWPVSSSAPPTPERGTTAARSGPAVPRKSDASFAQVCQDLRRRMDEITRAIKVPPR